jgi:hypothetical protein
MGAPDATPAMGASAVAEGTIWGRPAEMSMGVTQIRPPIGARPNSHIISRDSREQSDATESGYPGIPLQTPVMVESVYRVSRAAVAQASQSRDLDEQSELAEM